MPRCSATASAPRLQCLETTVPSDPARFPEISRFQNHTLHHHDQDVVRELSVPPELSLSTSPSAPTRPLHQRNDYTFHPHQPEDPSSSFLTSPYNASLDTSPRPRTPPTSVFAHHGLPASLPPRPRTTFYSNTQIPSEPDNLVSYLDSLLRGSYSKMLSTTSENTVPPSLVPELPQGAPHELSLDDMLRADYLDTNTIEFLTSPLLQDDSPEETPFLATPSEDIWTSPIVDEADDSFGFGDLPLFGAARKRGNGTQNDKDLPNDTISGKPHALESLQMLDILKLYSPPEPTAPSSFDSKLDSVTTPALDTLNATNMYTFPPTPAIPPASLYLSPRRPAHPPIPSTTSAPTSCESGPSFSATPSISNSSRPTKPLPTGTRRNISPSSLVPFDAPTQPRQYITPSVTSRKAVPTAFIKGKKRARSEVDLNGADDNGEGQADADVELDPKNLDPTTQDAIEAKRRQNTLAARRSRQRKLEHVRELEDTVERITRDRDMWMQRAYDAEAKLRAGGLE